MSVLALGACNFVLGQAFSCARAPQGDHASLAAAPPRQAAGQGLCARCSWPRSTSAGLSSVNWRQPPPELVPAPERVQPTLGGGGIYIFKSLQNI